MKTKTYENAMDAALAYLTARMRTKAETEDKLRTLGYTDDEIETTVERLEELRLIDDGTYASEFIRTRTASGNHSRKALRYQMMKHKIDLDKIEEALETIGPEQEYAAAEEIARREWRNRSSLEPPERRNKVFAKLCRGSFDMDVVCSVCRKLTEEGEECEIYDL